MAGDKHLLTKVMAELSGLGEISSRGMFGGYGIFHEGDMFALISGTGLFFKVDDSNRGAYNSAGSKQCKPVPYYQVPPNVLEDCATLLKWAQTSIDIAHATAKKKRPRR